MYLINLKIQEGANHEKVIRDVPFNKTGLNIIVDETIGGKGNNVGKTTFLRIIDICLAAKDKKYIWTDYDTGSENKILKEYIENNKVFAELTVSKNKQNYSFKRELFSRGTQYINGDKISYDNYRSELNEIFFNNSAPPHFRQLINKFVRIKQTDDTYGTLKFLHTNTSFDEYRNVYEFLFKLSDPGASSKKLELKNNIKNEEQLIKDLFKAHSIGNKDELFEKIRLLTDELAVQESTINKYISQNHYKESVEEITKTKDYINTLNDNLETLEFKQTKVMDILKQEDNNKNDIDYSLLKDFYNDVKKNIENVSVEFDELIKFNEQIKINKSKYYSTELSRIRTEIKNTKSKINHIIDKNSDILNLLDDDNFEKYKTIHEKLLKNKEALGELNEIKNAYIKVVKSLEVYKEQLKEIEPKNNNRQYIELFNNYFSYLSNEIIGQRLFLTPVEDSFPVKLSNIDDGVGTGYRKTITLLLDISYVYLLSKIDVDYPNFFVHDVLESLDEYNMKSIVQAIEDVKAQFVFAILKEKIANYDFIENKDIILELSEENKLFRI